MNAYRVAALVLLALAFATVSGTLWSVLAGDGSPWTLLLVPPSLLFYWWLYEGLQRRAPRP